MAKTFYYFYEKKIKFKSTQRIYRTNFIIIVREQLTYQDDSWFVYPTISKRTNGKRALATRSYCDKNRNVLSVCGIRKESKNSRVITMLASITHDLKPHKRTTCRASERTMQTFTDGIAWRSEQQMTDGAWHVHRNRTNEG